MYVRVVEEEFPRWTHGPRLELDAASSEANICALVLPVHQSCIKVVEESPRRQRQSSSTSVDVDQIATMSRHQRLNIG